MFLLFVFLTRSLAVPCYVASTSSTYKSIRDLLIYTSTTHPILRHQYLHDIQIPPTPTINLAAPSISYASPAICIVDVPLAQGKQRNDSSPPLFPNPDSQQPSTSNIVNAGEHGSGRLCFCLLSTLLKCMRYQYTMQSPMVDLRCRRSRECVLQSRQCEDLSHTVSIGYPNLKKVVVSFVIMTCNCRD
ncbi:hypothetical protein F4604DRAFT_1768923 [Suillus subluteus]|nr:hypothetical protein F4604DRAFT_1768923 [Suillus subluteus]